MITRIIYFAAVALAFALTVIISRFLIPVLRSHKMGQRILDIGPRWHKSKEGTPTMGGLAFIIALSVVGAAGAAYIAITGGIDAALPLIYTLAYALLNAGIGAIDDSAKLRKKQNEGLTAPQKYLLQLVAAASYLLALRLSGCIDTTLYFPFFDAAIELGVFYYVVALVLLTGVVNAVNLTDGIDGLASMVTCVLGVFFTLAAFFRYDSDGPLSLLGALIIGGTLGFLVYNYHPARVFMGDTGSLYLGALVIGGGFMLQNPLIILLAGLVYIIETASVILQVTYFKLTHGKRLFKMSPIHHHFEKCGWSELKIVYVFTAACALACAGAWFGLA